MVENKLLSDIKSKSLRNKIDIESRAEKWYSVSAMLNALEHPFDELKVATMCFNKAIPGGKYYGMTVEEIIASWKLKCSIAGDRGMNLDTYIQTVLHNKPRPIIDDENLIAKCRQFDILKSRIIDDKINFVGSEIWVNSAVHAFRGRLDALFEIDGFLVIFDWKNNDELKYNQFERMLGPCDFLQKADINRYTLQLYFYKYVLENEFGYKVKGVRVVHIKTDSYELLKPAFEYSKAFMEEVIMWSKEEVDRRQK